MKTICIYHSRDLDGWMSAAIVKKWWLFNNKYGHISSIGSLEKVGDKITGEILENEYNHIHFLGYDYGDEIPDLSEYDKVIMCDISFPVKEMHDLVENKDFIWIDHHISAINAWKEFVVRVGEENKPNGLQDTSFAACELTWKYFFPNEPMPEIVRLLGRYDCFGHKGTDEEQKVLEFQYGARRIISNYEEAYVYLQRSINHLKILNKHFSKERIKQLPDNIENDIYMKGHVIYQYLCTEAKQIYEHAFDIEILDKKFKCSNIGGFNPSAFNLPFTKDGYDGYVTFIYSNSKKSWTFSLRSETIDVSEIAKQYGGGGHKGAAGFVCDTETMRQITNIN
jgi:uncharacterized protein